MPHKKNANGRPQIPKMRHCVTNWREYVAGLRRRGSLTMWVTDEAMAAWAAGFCRHSEKRPSMAARPTSIKKLASRTGSLQTRLDL